MHSIMSYKRLLHCKKDCHKEVLLGSFYLNFHTVGFHTAWTQKLEPTTL